jgi:hypothetical protein
MVETILGELWYKGKRRTLVHVTSAGPSSYSTGGFTVTVNSLKQVEKVLSISNNGGYKSDAGDASIGTGANRNVVTVKVREYWYTCGGIDVAPEVASGENLSGVTFSLVVIGA